MNLCDYEMILVHVKADSAEDAFPIAHVGGVVPSLVGLRPIDSLGALEEGEEGLVLNCIAVGGGCHCINGSESINNTIASI
jgi:hypothetical protein